MATILNFSGGQVREISLPVDVTWSSDQCFRFASLAVMFEKHGFSQERASQLAESAILKEIHHAIFFDKETESSLKGPAETT